MKEINIEITSIEVKAETRKLRCEYTREMVSEIHAYSGLDINVFRNKLRKKSINNIFNNNKT